MLGGPNEFPEAEENSFCNFEKFQDDVFTKLAFQHKTRVNFSGQK